MSKTLKALVMKKIEKHDNLTKKFDDIIQEAISKEE